MADTQQPVEQQVSSKTPDTKQKNPKRVAAAKAIARKTREAREAQKKALIEAQSIIANYQPRSQGLSSYHHGERGETLVGSGHVLL